MEGGSLNNMKQKGKALMSEDMHEPMPSLNKVVKTEEGNPEPESTVKGSGENTLLQNDQPSPAAFVINSGGDVMSGSALATGSTPSRKVVKDLFSSLKRFPCEYCDSWFITAQALGGHQNIHKSAREQAKKMKLQDRPLREILPRYGGSPNTLPLYKYNKPTIPQSTTGVTLGQPGQPSGTLLNTSQFPVYNSPWMISPNTVNYVNFYYPNRNFNIGGTVVGGQGVKVEPNVVLNSMDVVGDGGRVSQGARNVSGDEGDRTLDLLSRVGMGSGEDEESNDKGGNGGVS